MRAQPELNHLSEIIDNCNNDFGVGGHNLAPKRRKGEKKVIHWEKLREGMSESFYEKVKEELEPKPYPETLQIAETLVMRARKGTCRPPLRGQILSLYIVLAYSEEKAMEYVRTLPKNQLVELAAYLSFLLLPRSRNFDVKKYYESLYKGRQKGRAYRSYHEH